MSQDALHPDLDRGPRRASLILVASLAGFVFLALAWMSFSKLDISVHAVGQVIPSSRIQLIQSLEGGIVRQLDVHEGQLVKRGQLLAYVENRQYDADLGEGQQNQFALEAAMARLDAELAGRAPVFSANLSAKAPDLVAKQRSLWSTRLQERDDAVETARRQVAQRKEELAEAKTRIESMTSMMASARENLAIEEKLLAQGAGARTDFLHAQQEVSRLQGDMDAARIAVPRIQAAIQEGNSHAAEVVSRYRSEASRERSDVEAKAAALGERIASSQDRVTRHELRSPMDGVVNRLLINTVGGVAKPGETIMELVPVQDTLLISARVKPSDIAFIHAGQVASVSITAYDSSIFGKMQAKVQRVGADAILDERKEQSYFEIWLETDRNYLGKPEERLTISPGMAADASINTGKRTLMEYMLKPVVKTFDKALRER